MRSASRKIFRWLFDFLLSLVLLLALITVARQTSAG